MARLQDSRALVCPICLEFFKQARVIPCGHTFCHGCIRTLESCPLCRKKFETSVPNYSLNEVMDHVDTSSSLLRRHEIRDFLKTAISLNIQEQEKIKAQLACLNEDFLNYENLESLTPELQSLKSRRSVNRSAFFDDITQAYFSMRCPIGASEPNKSDWEDFYSALDDCVRFSSFREQAMLHYGEGPLGTPSIVSCMEFDKDGDLFVVAGMTGMIKIFDYHAIGHPLCEFACTSKLSCVAFNPCFKHQISSSDHDGTLAVWDINHIKRSHTYQEHKKLIWSLAYNPSDPHVLATGGDDCFLKLWNLTSSHSMQSYQTGTNVCCVRFHPSNVYQLAYSSTEHTITLMDTRKFTQPLQVMIGHRKGVSYVSFLPHEDTCNSLVSASIDGELKLWCLRTNTVVRTYSGHSNKKYFVGMTTNNKFIACGSEDNSIYLYQKFLSRPILKYQFNDISPTQTKHFVSYVCFRKGSNDLLAANSQGVIKVLQMVE